MVCKFCASSSLCKNDSQRTLIEALCTTVTGRFSKSDYKKCKLCADASALLRTSCYVWWCSLEAVLSDGVHHGVCASIGSQHHESLIHDRSPSYEWMSQHFYPLFSAVLLLHSDYKTFRSICDVCKAAVAIFLSNFCVSHSQATILSKNCSFCEWIFILTLFNLIQSQSFHSVLLQIATFLNPAEKCSMNSVLAQGGLWWLELL